MWAAGYELGFTEATVVQERNPHNLMTDFESEIPIFLQAQSVISIVSEALDPKSAIKDNLRLAYVALSEEGIVSKDEVSTLDAWLGDLSGARAISTKMTKESSTHLSAKTE